MWNDKEEYNLEKCREEIQEKNVKLQNHYSRYIDNNLYLYVQIVLVMIFLVAGVMFRANGGQSFLFIKENYNTVLSSETIMENKFSYESFAKKIMEDMAQKYNALVQAISYTYGKGSNNLYPSDVSLEKYTLPELGMRPLDGYISSPFGVRKDPFNGKKKDFHTGMDIAADKGTFIKAAFSGTVLNAEYSSVAGNYIRIETNDTLQSFYGHSQFLFVKPGDKVLKGQVIASVGQSGMATGPHLHFEVIYNGRRVNPIYAIE